jgi:2-oxoisovalerate dehydrogenase E1 component
MSKQLYVDPNVVRKPDSLTFPPIPVNQYQGTVKDEKKNYTKDEFLHIYRDMCYIREFETMLNLIKTTNEYQGVQCKGPALHPDSRRRQAHEDHGELF